MVTDVATDITQVQTVSGREEGFEKQVAVLITSGAVTRTRRLGHAIEAQGSVQTRELAVTHAQQTDDLKGKAPHGYHGATCDTTGEKPGGPL